jgi:hypothetical protein
MRNRTVIVDIKTNEKRILNSDKVTNFLLKNKGKFFTASHILKTLDLTQGGNTNNTIHRLVKHNIISKKECECKCSSLYGIMT